MSTRRGNRGTRFITRGRGKKRRVIPIRSRPTRSRTKGILFYVPKKGPELDKLKPMTVADLEREAERMAFSGKPIKLIAMKRMPDGLFHSYTQSFDNWKAASRAAVALKNDGYDVGMAGTTGGNGA